MADDDDDDIDSETLQAQADLAMSLMDEMVDSWIKPAYKDNSKSTPAFTEADLEEYVRRPPRLGVGASLPESTGVSGREAMRLKGQLIGNGGAKGKKREREREGEEGAGPARKGDNEDEEESRAGAIRKKLKFDWLGGFGKKKKKKGTLAGPSGSQKSDPKEAGASTESKSSISPAKDATALWTGSSPQIKQSALNVDGNDDPWSPAPSQRSARIGAEIQRYEAGRERAAVSPPPAVKAQSTTVPSRSVPLESNGSPPSPTNRRGGASPQDKLTRSAPILNLSGSHRDGLDGPGGEGEGSESLKKKRRRRRKKKKGGDAGGAEGS